MVGGTLLGVDGSVIDAGAPHGSRRSIARRAPGLPEGGLPRGESARTTRVAAECVGLSRTALDMLLTDATWHPDPDVMLAQAVEETARQGGGARTLLRGRCVRFAEASPRDAASVAADASALELILKRSFSLVGDEGRAMSTLRILQVAHDHPDWTPGGTEIVAHDLARALNRAARRRAPLPRRRDRRCSAPAPTPGALRALGEDLVLQHRRLRPVLDVAAATAPTG